LHTVLFAFKATKHSGHLGPCLKREDPMEEGLWD